MIDGLLELDQSLFVLLNQRWVSPWLDGPVQFLTQGKILQYVALICVGAAVLRLRLRAVPILAALVTAVALSNSTSDVVKSIVDRPRPFVTEKGMRLLVGQGRVASFPSSHAANAAALTVAAIAMLGFGSRKRQLFAMGLSLMTLWVGWSRVYVGAHFPADILSGWALGAMAGLVAVLLWTRFPALSPVVRGRLRVDFFHLAVIVTVIFSVFRVAFVVTHDQGLTPAEALLWHIGRHPMALPEEALGPNAGFMPLLANLLGAIHSREASALRWVVPMVGFVVMLLTLVVLRWVGLSRSMAGALVLFLQSIPAVNCGHVWFVETLFSAIPWVLALGGWARWSLNRKPDGLILITFALVLCLLNLPSLLVVATGLWMLEHFRGDYSKQSGRAKSLLIGLGLLVGCLILRFTRPGSYEEGLWRWSWLSTLVAAGFGTVLLTALAVGLFVRAVVLTRHARSVLGLRLRAVLWYSLGTSVACVWMGGRDHISGVMLLAFPALMLASKVPALIRRRGIATLSPAGRIAVGFIAGLALAINVATLYLIYDKDTIRRLPGRLVEARWITGWPDRTRPLARALRPNDVVVATDSLTVAALSHVLDRQVGLLLPPTSGPRGHLAFLVREVDGSLVPLMNQIVVVAPWGEASLNRTARSWRDLAMGLGPARDDLPTSIALDRPQTILLGIYQLPQKARPTSDQNRLGWPLTPFRLFDPVAP